MGGWIAIAGYCSSGFNPRPSATDVMPRPTASIRNGLATNAFKIRKKHCGIISVAVTQGMIPRCLRRLVNITTAA